MFDERFEYCFNSYYESVGRAAAARQARAADAALRRAGARLSRASSTPARPGCSNGVAPGRRGLIELGINHEQQHQELLLTDILSLFASEPLKPAYRQRQPRRCGPAMAPLDWVVLSLAAFRRWAMTAMASPMTMKARATRR